MKKSCLDCKYFRDLYNSNSNDVPRTYKMYCYFNGSYSRESLPRSAIVERPNWCFIERYEIDNDKNIIDYD